MNAGGLSRLAVGGALVVGLVGLLVVAGAGWTLTDPEQPVEAGTTSGEGDARSGEGDVASGESGTSEGDIDREPWEETYMYAVSALGGLLVLGRLVDTWRFRPRSVLVEPRSSPLHDRVRATLRDENAEPSDAAESTGPAVQRESAESRGGRGG